MAAVLALGGVVGCGGDGSDEASGGKQVTTAAKEAPPAPASWVTLRDKRTGFSVQAPRGYELEVHKGVYVMKQGDRTITFSRVVTGASPAAYGKALLRQIGGTVASKESGDDVFTAATDSSAGRETFVVRRAGDRLEVTTGRAPEAAALPTADVERVGGSAQGGVALRAPAGGGEALALKPYRTPDGGATAMVPSEPGWSFDGGQGVVLGSSDKGSFTLGRTFKVLLPESAPQGGTDILPAAPYVEDPAEAASQVLPKANPAVSNIRVRKTVRTGVLPSFSASGMYVLDYDLKGKPWTSVATIGVDSPDKYSNFLWSMYYSGIGVPAGSDPGVGSSLLKVWRSWDPSGAIAQRSQQAKALLDQSNDVWQQTSEFRARTADRQSRDVGCLLQGYSEIEDNSRKYDLPPLPCDQQYAPGG
jgi:hypothetical protein